MSYKIPQSNKKFTQTNQSDLSGNIWYTKNIDLSEEGYIKLASRAVQLISDDTSDSINDSNFNIISSIGRYGSGGVHFMVGSDAPFTATLSQTALTMAEDTLSNNPDTDSNSRGKWYKNVWHVSTDTTVSTKAIAGTWTADVITGLTSGVAHPIEVFRNKDSIVVGNGNTVKLYNNVYALQSTLTIPTDYEIKDIVYSNYRVGIITTLSSGASGQNQEAFFFVWDGSSSEAQSGIPIGSESIVAITPYKNSWAILSLNGQILYFNGGGFTELAVFPFFSKDRIWDGSVRGEVMITDGDLIYIQVNGFVSVEGIKQETILQNNPAGIWCYDPKVGLYHKYSPSISQVYIIRVLAGGANTTTDLLTADSGTIPITGSPIKLTFSPTDPIGGIKSGQIYYVIKVSPTTFRLATTKANAIAGTYIDITSQSASTSSFQVLVLKDYGQTYITTSGALGLTDTKTIVYDGTTYSFRGLNATGIAANYFGMTVSGFDNIGYIVTPKLESAEVEEIINKVYTRFQPLKTNDSITLKYKSEEVLGLPVSTPQIGASCTWTSTTTLTTTADISEADAYLDEIDKELELEIIQGAGAGQMVQISSITESAGTYTVTLAEEVEGVSANNVCNVIIDNWKTLGQITSADKFYKELPLGSTSKAVKFKIILKGTEVTLEEIYAVSQTHLKAV
jgi:hypothetical protein